MPAKKITQKGPLDQPDEVRRGAMQDMQRQDNQLAFTVRMRNRLPPPPPGDFTIRVKFRFKATGFEEAASRLRRLFERNDLVMQMLKVAVIRSIVVNIRGRFIANMTKALEMKVLEQSGKPVAISPRERLQDVAAQQRLANAFANLNKAQSEGASEEIINGLRDRVMAAGERLRESLGKTAQGTPYGHKLSERAGNQFRRMMVRMLALLADAQLVGVERSQSGVMIGVGPMQWLDQLETPSATMALTGLPTGSRFRSFWRHLEFGTGAKRKVAGNAWGAGRSPTWWYGRRKKGSLLLEGTLPMNFLTDDNGQIYANDMEALEKALTKALDDILSVKV